MFLLSVLRLKMLMLIKYSGLFCVFSHSPVLLSKCWPVSKISPEPGGKNLNVTNRRIIIHIYSRGSLHPSCSVLENKVNISPPPLLSASLQGFSCLCELQHV